MKNHLIHKKGASYKRRYAHSEKSKKTQQKDVETALGKKPPKG